MRTLTLALTALLLLGVAAPASAWVPTDGRYQTRAHYAFWAGHGPIEFHVHGNRIVNFGVGDDRMRDADLVPDGDRPWSFSGNHRWYVEGWFTSSTRVSGFVLLTVFGRTTKYNWSAELCGDPTDHRRGVFLCV
jgi:hypothetical protein